MTISDSNQASKPANWSIETAEWRDFSQLKHLERMCFKSEDIWPFWDLIGILTLPGMVRLKAVLDDRMVGFIGGEIRASREQGWVTTLAVMPAYRRRGIAKALLQECEIALGTETVRLSVRASNHTAIRLYENTGYQVIDRWERYYTGGEDALVLEKRR